VELFFFSWTQNKASFDHTGRKRRQVEIAVYIHHA
jgi:hypothetical protein